MGTVRHRLGDLADPLAVLLAALAVYLTAGLDGPLDRDLGVFVYGGERVAAGVPPYRGVFNSVGPLADALPGLAMRVGAVAGVDPVTSARVLSLLLAAATCALVAVLARVVLHRRAAGYLAAVVLLLFGELTRLAGSGPREKTAMLFFLCVALLALTRRGWVVAGVATALATLTWQPALLVALACWAVAAWRTPGGRLRAVGGYLAGGAFPTAVAVAVLAAAHGLRLAVDGFVVVNLTDKRDSGAWGDPPTVWTEIRTGYGASLLLLVVGLVGLVGLAAIRRTDTGLVTVAAGAATGVGVTIVSVNGAPDLFVLLPFAAVGVAGLAVRAVDAATRRARPLAGPAVAGVLAVVMLGVALAQATALRSTRLDVQRRNVAAVLAAAPPGPVLSINAPEVLALAGRTNPTRWQVFDGAQRRFLDQHLAGGLAAYARWIGMRRPPVVVTDEKPPQRWLASVLSADYVRVGSACAWTWWVSRGTPPAQVAALRAADADTRS